MVMPKMRAGMRSKEGGRDDRMACDKCVTMKKAFIVHAVLQRPVVLFVDGHM